LIQAKRLGHVTFETPDLAGATSYYTETVGLVVTAHGDGLALLSTPLGELAVVLKQGFHARCETLSFEIAPRMDAGEAVAMLSKHGIRADVKSDSVPGIGRCITFSDPKGTSVELFSERPGATRAGGAAIMPFKLGHVAYSVADPASLAKFYQTVLGFRISDWIEDLFVFLRCNADHHTLNFIAGTATALHHFAFALRDASHVQNACDVLARNQMPILWGPVRLGPGHNVAVFHKNPDGQVVELYAELDRMLDEELGYFEPRPWHMDLPQRPKVWGRSEGMIWGLPPSPEFPRNFARRS
jgi:catechol-2,3-dioxygenase